MRRKRDRILSFLGNDAGLPKTVREYREKYKGMSRILDEHSEVLDRVHRDLKGPDPSVRCMINEAENAEPSKDYMMPPPVE